MPCHPGLGEDMHDGERTWRERGLRDAVLAGDAVAWRTWYQEAYAPLEAYVLWRCGYGRDLADDVLQETWLTAVRAVRRFQPETGSFQQWLRGIASNVLRNQLRQLRRRQRRQQPFVNEATHPNGVMKADQGERIAQALAALPQRYEQALRAKYLDQRSVGDIAAETGQTAKAVESLLTRARAAFREAYLHEE